MGPTMNVPTGRVISFARISTFLTLFLTILIFNIPNNLAAQAQARQLSWTYRYDPPGQQGRTWTQVGPTRWIELCQSGQQNNFTVVNAAATVEGNRGQIVEREDHALFVFVPNANAQGVNPDWLRVWKKGDAKWSLLGNFSIPKRYTY